VTREVDDLLADLAEAADAAAELVGLGKERWDTERPLCLPGEATPEIPWREVKGMRIMLSAPKLTQHHPPDTVMGGLSTPRRTLMAGFPEIHRMGHGRVFGVVSVPDVHELAAGSRPRLAA
jgi:hypothetical protein